MMHVTLRRLEVLVAIAECGGFASAAARLGIAQPSVSAHVAALEQEMGDLLFERRRGRQPVLTPFGTSLLGHARQLLSEARGLAQTARQHAAAPGRRVDFACQRSVAHAVMETALTDFARRQQGIELRLRIGGQEEVVAAVAGGVADLGCILSNDPVPGLTSRVIGWQEMVFAAAATHPLARRRAIDPASLAREPFVGPPADSLFGRNVASLLAGIGLKRLTQVSQATEYPFLRRLVAAEVGLCFTLRCSVAADVAAGTLAVLDVVAPCLGLQVREVTAPGQAVPLAVERFRGFLAQYDFGRMPG